MSKAGVEAITVQAALAVFFQARLCRGGQIRASHALKQSQAFPSLMLHCGSDLDLSKLFVAFLSRRRAYLALEYVHV
jgi:hypothetical protein